MPAPSIPASFFAALLAALVAVPAIGGAATPAPVVSVTPDVPSDIPGGARNASLQAASLFAWQEFIALNWPAKAGQRDAPDLAQKFGAATSGPLVWHTYRSKSEIFPGANSKDVVPHGYMSGAPSFGYNDPPQYQYAGSPIPACAMQGKVNVPAWINLDEGSQIGLNLMYAGAAPAAPTPLNSRPQLIRFLAKANLAEYAYVAQNQYWYDASGSPRYMAVQNFRSAQRNGFPVKGAFIKLPDGSFEIKAAFRPLSAAETASQRFYTTTVRYYEGGNTPCFREAQWGLVALHIIQKTPSAPAFVFATFEQADNLQQTIAGKAVAVEDEDGNIVHPATTATTPALSYKDSASSPLVSIQPAGAANCSTDGDSHLFYTNVPNGGVPSGKICVNQRDHAIPPAVIAVNKVAHAAMAAYSKTNGVANSPWAYYKLVNVQAYPFNKADIVSDPNSPRNAATYYQANSVVETNYTLQNFDGQVALNGAPTNFDVTKPRYQNAYIVKHDGSLVSSFNMGGCMGCHGVASRQGADFSFLLGKPPVPLPDTPALSEASMKANFKAMFHGAPHP